MVRLGKDVGRKVAIGVARGLGVYLVYSILPYVLVTLVPQLGSLAPAITSSLLGVHVLLIAVALSVFAEVAEPSIAKMIGYVAVKLLYIKLYLNVASSSVVWVQVEGGAVAVDFTVIFHLILLYITASIALDIMSTYNRSLKNLVKGKDVLSS